MWHQVPSIAEVGELCFEEGMYIFGASREGNYYQWTLFRRLGEDLLEDSHEPWNFLGNGPHVSRGFDWAQRTIFEKGWPVATDRQDEFGRRAIWKASDAL